MDFHAIHQTDCSDTFLTGGRVFFVSSSVTKFSGVPPDYLLYSATKGSVEQMTRVLSKDLGSRGINVNAIAPGPTKTDLFLNGKSDELIDFFIRFSASSPLHPLLNLFALQNTTREAELYMWTPFPKSPEFGE